MNEILTKLEEMSVDDLIYVFEYLTDLINYKKEQEQLKKKLLKQKENLTINSQQKCLFAQTADNSQTINTHVQNVVGEQTDF